MRIIFFVAFTSTLMVLLQNALAVELSDAEKKWIENNPVIRVGAETDWPPYDFSIAGRATGLSNEYLAMLTDKVGLKIEFIVGPTFNELLEMARQRKLDVLPALWFNEEREKYLSYLRPYYTAQHGVFLSRKSQRMKKIREIEDISRLHLIGVAGYNSTRQLYKEFPEAKITEVPSPLDALLALNGNEADAYIGSLGVSSYYIQENGLENIKVMTGLKGSSFSNNEELHVAVRKDWPLLVSILSKAEKEIMAHEMKALRDRWVQIPGEKSIPWFVMLTWTLGIGFLFSIVITYIARWNRRLAAEVSERRQAEKEIEEHRANLLEVMEATEDGIWSIDHQYRLTICNSVFQESLKGVFGRTIEIGESLINLAEKELSEPEMSEKWKEWYDRVLEGERFTIEEQNGEVDYEFRFMPIEAAGKVAGATCTMHDITAQKKLERSLIESKEAAEEASRTKSLFLANMSHEIRTPMNGILGLASLLADTKLSDDQKSHVDQLQKSGKSLLGVIDDILNIIKFESGKIELENTPFDLSSLVYEVTELVSRTDRAEGLKLEVKWDPSLPKVVDGDGHRLRQCLINLLGNAVKFTEKGSVVVKVVKKEGGLVEIAVTDSGVGIPKDRQSDIFDAFVQADISTTRKYGGTGLGLAITNKMVRLMGGELELESEVGSGSTFFIRIPLSASRQKLIEEPSQALEGREEWASARVLVVEDSKVNVLVVVGFLRYYGIEVDVAHNGREALVCLAEKDYHLVLMDCHMPEMDGFEATRLIRSGSKDVRNPKIPIIALTADVMTEVVEHCEMAGMDDYLSKPLDRYELELRLEKYLFRFISDSD